MTPDMGAEWCWMVIHHSGHTNCSVTVAEAAERLAVRTDEVYRLLRAKRLYASKDGKVWKICLDCVSAHGANSRRRRRKS